MKINLTSALGALVAAIGAWFWYTENSYAMNHNSDLAATLQWVGVGQFLTGITIILISKKENK